jgi:hypothetical protein
MTLRELRSLINVLIRESEFYDSYFLEDIIPMLRDMDLLPPEMGQLINCGNEACVFAFGNDQVIRLHPTYEMPREAAERVFERQKSAPSGGLYVKVFDVGKIEAFDDDEGEETIYAVYSVLERLQDIDNKDAVAIDDVVTGSASIEDIDASEQLKMFLEKYMSLPLDHDSNNVMMRDNDYVIIDPE